METDAGDELELELGTDGAIAMLSIAKEDRFPDAVMYSSSRLIDTRALLVFLKAQVTHFTSQTSIAKRLAVGVQ